jgi:hypothetical protein
VLEHGNRDLASRFAWFFLQCWEAEPGDLHGPPGLGACWLYLERQHMGPPVDPSELAELALRIPDEFFLFISQDDLPFFCRLLVASRAPLDIWYLHALLTALARANLPGRAPFAVFKDLMSFDAVPVELRRELCRGLLECPNEFQRMIERGKALQASFSIEDGEMRTPWCYVEIRSGGAGRRHPGLKRYAVRALVDPLGEPLRKGREQLSSDAMTEGVLDLLRAHAEELGLDVVKQYFSKATRSGSAPLRQAAYRLGAEQFGPSFALPARKDPARMVRDWAEKWLSKHKPKRDPASRSPRPRQLEGEPDE